MTTLTLKIPDPAIEQLRAQAAASNKPVEQFASELLQAQARASAVLQSFREQALSRFQASGMTEQMLAEQLEREDHQSRGVVYDE
jgi:hypothetical protein